jgi:hypothetical protein
MACLKLVHEGHGPPRDWNFGIGDTARFGLMLAVKGWLKETPGHTAQNVKMAWATWRVPKRKMDGWKSLSAEKIVRTLACFPRQ